MTLREKIEIMEACERGEQIECCTSGYNTSWHYVKTPSWNWKDNDYRIKLKPKQTVVIEEWLCMYKDCYVVKSTSDIDTFIKDSPYVEKNRIAFNKYLRNRTSMTIYSVLIFFAGWITGVIFTHVLHVLFIYFL